MKTDLEQLKEDVKDTKETVNNIYLLLKGNPLNEKRGGMVDQVETHHERILDLEDRLKSWKQWAIGATSTTVLSALAWFYRTFLS